MPKLVNRPPSYRLHRSSGQAVVVLRGRYIYLGRYGSEESRAAYNRILGEWRADSENPAAAAMKSVLAPFKVKELLSRYWDFAETYYVKNGRPTSEIGAIRSAVRPLAALYADVPVSDFTPLGLKAVREVMIKNGLCRKSINAHVGRIRRIVRWGVAEELVPESSPTATSRGSTSGFASFGGCWTMDERPASRPPSPARAPQGHCAALPSGRADTLRLARDMAIARSTTPAQLQDRRRSSLHRRGTDGRGGAAVGGRGFGPRGGAGRSERRRHGERPRLQANA